MKVDYLFEIVLFLNESVFNINFPLRAAFATSHKLGYVVFPFSFVKIFFDFPLFLL